MIAFWRIEEIDKNGQCVERYYRCDTSEIDDPDLRFPLELSIELHSVVGRRILRYRKLFAKSDENHFLTEATGTDFPRFIVLRNYFEDTDAQPLSTDEALHRKFGVPRDLVRLDGRRQPHDIQFAIDIANGLHPLKPTADTMGEDDRRVLSEFVRDLKILKSSRFFQQASPFKLSFVGFDGSGTLVTIGSEHINHAVTVFRRIHAQKEPASFKKACDVLFKVAPDAPATKWVGFERREYNKLLASEASHIALGRRDLPFTNEQLIQLYLNGDFAHPGTAGDEAERNMFAQAAGGGDALRFLFLNLFTDLSYILFNCGQFMERLLVYSDVEPGSATTSSSFRKAGPAFAKEELLRDDDRKVFELCLSTYAERLYIRNLQRTPLHDCLERARAMLREVL